MGERRDHWTVSANLKVKAGALSRNHSWFHTCVTWKRRGTVARTRGCNLPASQDIQLCIDAYLSVPSNEVVQACQRAAACVAISTFAKLSSDRLNITLHPKVYKFRSVGCESPVLAIVLEPSDAGTHLTTRVESYWTFQTFFLGLVPFGPRHLIGLKSFKQLLAELEAELRRLDQNARISRVKIANRVQPTRNVKG